MSGVGLYEIPDYAVTSPQTFMDWVMYQVQWPPVGFMPLLCICPLCSAIVINDWQPREAHAAWHGDQVVDRP